MGVFERIGGELALLDGIIRTLRAYKPLQADGDLTVADDIERSIDLHSERPAFRFEGKTLTYAGFESRANQYAHWALAQGLKAGDVVALFMSNRPDYVACWIGLSKVGIVTALINSNLAGAPLAHSINISNADHVIVSSDLAAAIAPIGADLARKPQIWSQGGLAEGAKDLDGSLSRMSENRPPRDHRAALKSADIALYVYTSGTTGAPKAARMTHLRVMGMMRAFIGGGHATQKDRVYIPLPLYHGTGGLCGIGFALETGGCVILRRKFSASHFWEECAEEGATVFFYIGELCRYLLNAAPHPMERVHHLRLGVGNGLRPEVWGEFQSRFRVKKILEFYGSTEGNVSLLNFEGRIGSVGRIPGWMRKSLNVRIVKFDVETETPVRGPDGFCIEAAPDEPGEALGEIRADEARFKYEGYAGDKAQSEKKVLRNVFAEGDAWFRTGDLLRQDKDGYFYFVDRIGDTFRWKGENVSTNEVADVIARFPGVQEANVYGVQIPGQDGRAGMAAITAEADFDLTEFRAFLARELPPYARPVFLRLQPMIETTGTFKYRKVDLVRDGFDLAKTADPILFDDPAAGAYTPWTPDLAARLAAGEIKL